MSGKVLVTGTSVAERFLEPLKKAGLQIDNPSGVLSEQELGDALSDASAYLLGGDEFASEGALRRGKGLKIVAFLGVGYESFIDTKAATNLGIAVTNTPGTLTQSVAEFTIGQTLNATRRLALYGGYLRNEQLATVKGEEEKRHDMRAMPIGIIGLGTIGTRIAEILVNGFGCSVSYYSRTRKPAEEQRLNIRFEPLNELLSRNRIIILMMPGNETTKHFLGPNELSNLQPGTILINTARSELVNPAALLAALKSGAIETAVFDGFYDSQVAETPLLLGLSEDRLIVTRHIASLTHEARDGMAKMAVNSILSILDTNDDPHVVNRRR